MSDPGMTRITLSFLLSLLSDNNLQAPEAPILSKHHWSYKGPEGPDSWPTHYKHCGGVRQSPIDIQPTTCVYDPQLEPFVLEHFDYTSASNGPLILNVTNNGHAASVRVHSDDLRVKGGGLKTTYKTAEFHFHWGSSDDMGSEHAVNGRKFPLEMHVVNFAEKYGNIKDAMTESDGLAVLGVFFELSDKDNPNFAALDNALTHVHKAGEHNIVDKFRIRDLLPDNVSKYWRYNGSLTTPFCFETVTWTLFTEPQKISSKQLETLRSLLHEDGHEMSNRVKSHPASNHPSQLVDNWRPLQPLNGRVVTRSFQDDPIARPVSISSFPVESRVTVSSQTTTMLKPAHRTGITPVITEVTAKPITPGKLLPTGTIISSNSGPDSPQTFTGDKSMFDHFQQSLYQADNQTVDGSSTGQQTRPVLQPAASRNSMSKNNQVPKDSRPGQQFLTSGASEISTAGGNPQTTSSGKSDPSGVQRPVVVSKDPHQNRQPTSVPRQPSFSPQSGQYETVADLNKAVSHSRPPQQTSHPLNQQQLSHVQQGNQQLPQQKPHPTPLNPNVILHTGQQPTQGVLQQWLMRRQRMIEDQRKLLIQQQHLRKLHLNQPQQLSQPRTSPINYLLQQHQQQQNALRPSRGQLLQSMPPVVRQNKPSQQNTSPQRVNLYPSQHEHLHHQQINQGQTQKPTLQQLRSILQKLAATNRANSRANTLTSGAARIPSQGRQVNEVNSVGGVSRTGNPQTVNRVNGRLQGIGRNSGLRSLTPSPSAASSQRSGVGTNGLPLRSNQNQANRNLGRFSNRNGVTRVTGAGGLKNGVVASPTPRVAQEVPHVFLHRIQQPVRISRPFYERLYNWRHNVYHQRSPRIKRHQLFHPSTREFAYFRKGK